MQVHRYKITDTQPGSECQLLGTVTGVQNGGYQALVLKANHYVVLLMIYATKAAAMGGNVIFNVGTGAGSIVDSFCATR